MWSSLNASIDYARGILRVHHKKSSYERGGWDMSWVGHLVRFVVAALALLIVGAIVPQFHVGGFWSALLLALAIAVLGFAIEGIFGKRIQPFGRGIIGFVVSALVIYVAQFVIAGVFVTALGAIIAAVVIGLVDVFLPMASPFALGRKPHRST
jgi:hypothetical protein